ncbi:MAG: ferredoxin [Methanoregulaceae archaeon]
MKVTINRNECVSCGTCVDSCPAFFELGADDNFSQVCEAYRKDGMLEEGEAPPDLEACVTEAADLCPVQVIFTG